GPLPRHVCSRASRRLSTVRFVGRFAGSGGVRPLGTAPSPCDLPSGDGRAAHSVRQGGSVPAATGGPRRGRNKSWPPPRPGGGAARFAGPSFSVQRGRGPSANGSARAGDGGNQGVVGGRRRQAAHRQSQSWSGSGNTWGQLGGLRGGLWLNRQDAKKEELKKM